MPTSLLLGHLARLSEESRVHDDYFNATARLNKPAMLFWGTKAPSALLIFPSLQHQQVRHCSVNSRLKGNTNNPETI